MAEQEQVQLLTRNIDEWNQWRRQYPEIRLDLSGADLSRANLGGAYLFWADLSEASLFEADLRGAYLNRAALFETDLRGANLSGANLRRSRLISSNLSYANLSEANLMRADLSYANLSYANLSETNFRESHFFHTTFASVNLSSVKALETAVHDGPSIVDIKSVTLPHDEHIRRLFLRNIGFSDTFMDYLPYLFTIPIRYHSLFLCYSHHDQVLAKQLYNDLQNQGVRCWFAPHYLYPPMVQASNETIILHEKLLLVLSTDVVTSDWVQQEVESILHKEVTTKQEILFPIRLDDTVLECEALWAKRLCQRHIGDFTGWQDDAAYQQAFSTLLQHLKVVNSPPPQQTTPPSKQEQH